MMRKTAADNVFGLNESLTTTIYVTIFVMCPTWIYSGCQKNVPIAERFFATTLMPPAFLFGTLI
jgi:hypothetical protein